MTLVSHYHKNVSEDEYDEIIASLLFKCRMCATTSMDRGAFLHSLLLRRHHSIEENVSNETESQPQILPPRVRTAHRLTRRHARCDIETHRKFRALLIRASCD